MSKTIVSGGGAGIKEWYGVLPDEAKEALRTGEYWSNEPESSDGGDSIAVWCESCGRYHQFYVETGLEVEDKTLYVTLWHVDTDGDWSQVDRCPADDPDFAEWERRNLGYEASGAASRPAQLPQKGLRLLHAEEYVGHSRRTVRDR
jgi:hypothetical protein